MSMSSLVSNFSADNEWRHCPQYAGNKKAGRPKVEKRKTSAIEKYGKSSFYKKVIKLSSRDKEIIKKES